ncbi:universal stress protein [Aquimarina mytili]|uniref:Universal stress protein n=1 Tax=Aquimarina mytili TaxID=874423 RepID=A0A936ZP76_9FLAO|nr:universal stress protein [Aquimarina mytili]MBL0682877.1 universal stress protein [Aquimarina mytili]
MDSTKYRMLALTDLSKSSMTILKNAAQLAKAIGGKIEVFYVKAPADVVNYENQFSAIRAIQEDSRRAQKRLKTMVRKIEKEENIKITFQIAYGNIKNAIQEKISKTKPDIVLLGRRKSKLVNFLSNGITKFLLNECPANVLIAGEDDKFYSYDDTSLGVYGDVLQKDGIEIINDLNQKNSNPIRFFSIRNTKNTKKNIPQHRNTKEKVSYIFSEGTNALDGITSYVSRTNMQLFCISRKHQIKSSLQQMVYKLDIPVLILE